MEDINLHFTGDFNAIGLANNMLAALIDNHIHHGNALGIDVRRVTWRRVVDMNDRALRDITVALGGPGNGYPREDGFDIVVASEIMAIFCLATDLDDMKERLGRIVIGYTREKEPVYARDVNAEGAMTVCSRTHWRQPCADLGRNAGFRARRTVREHRPRVQQLRPSGTLADYVVTEAGFGADLGAEKFIDITCRSAGLRPSAAVIVATVRALKHHGGASGDDLTTRTWTH